MCRGKNGASEQGKWVESPYGTAAVNALFVFVGEGQSLDNILRGQNTNFVEIHKSISQKTYKKCIEVITEIRLWHFATAFFYAVCPAKLDHTCRCKSGRGNRQ